MSAIKHLIRQNKSADINENEDIFNIYIKIKNSCKNVARYWKQSDLNRIERFLEEKPNNQSLTEYYFGDIFESCGQDVRNVLSQQKNTDHKDSLDQCVYLITFLNKKINIDKIKNIVADTTDIQNIISKDHLLKYLDFLKNMILKSQKKKQEEEALFNIGLEKNTIDKIINIIYDL